MRHANAGHSDGGGSGGMKWRRNDDDERNLIEYDSLAFQAENGKFPALWHSRMNSRVVLA